MLTWNGRRLTSDGTNTYTNNSDGIRTSKTVDGVEHIYHLSGTQILSEEWTENGVQHLLIYIYDASGAPIGMAYRDSTYVSGAFDFYLFAKNAQGDILYIYNTSGTRLVTYTYDAWGKCYVTYQNGGASTAARYNPFRYRGYYYDTETGFYYLNSRYYDPAVGRFLNADGYVNANGDILGFNMFAYCGNNPVTYKDETGESITVACIIVGIGIGITIGAIGGSHYAKHIKGTTQNDGWDYWKYVVAGGAGGGLIGGLAGWAFAGTGAAASISWWYYKATTAIGTSAYAIGHAFEEWFYRTYNVVDQQVRYMGYRFDAIYNNYIVELKNYNWSNYSNLNSIIRSFITQARNYMQFVGDKINGYVIKGVEFYFSSKPPQELIDALNEIGVKVKWVP